MYERHCWSEDRRKEKDPVTLREYFVLLKANWPPAHGSGVVEAGWCGTMMLDPTQTKQQQYWEVMRVWDVERRKDGLDNLPANALTSLYHVVPNDPDAVPGTDQEG